ncbi:MAG: hypothetical protein RJB26_1822 [Pseudomonadota bacterium]|jgi:phage gp29-like protein
MNALAHRVTSAIGRVFNRAQPTASGSPGGKSAGELVRSSNAWRDNYNPLRGLAVGRVIAMIEAAERGDFAELQLTLRKVERRYPVLKGLIARLTGALEKLDWDIKVMDPLPEGATPEQAEAQRKFLRARYDLVENLSEALGQLCLAEVRGYAILQKHRHTEGPNDGAVRELHWLPADTWCRDGQFGDWFYNRDSRFGMGRGSAPAVLGEANRLGSETLPRADFVLRECDTPLYEIALLAFVNWLMGRKDYAAFVEIFGLPNSVVILPPNIKPGEESAYQASAEKVADGISGALPHGSDVKFPTAGVRGEAPFKAFCDAQDADVVLAGTGGRLSMLTADKGGLGNGPADEHASAFDEIGQAIARRISETLQRDFDRPELAAEFPGQPCLVYFQLAAEQQDDVQALVANVVALKSAGYAVDEDWLAERTGYQLDDAEEPSTLPGGEAGAGDEDDQGEQMEDEDEGEPLLNRAAPASPKGFRTALAADLQPYLTALSERVDRILTITDAALRERKLAEAFAELEPMKADILKDPASARQLQTLLAQAMANGLTDKPATPKPETQPAK